MEDIDFVKKVNPDKDAHIESLEDALYDMKKFLTFFHHRLMEVYGESPNLDYHIKVNNLLEWRSND